MKRKPLLLPDPAHIVLVSQHDESEEEERFASFEQLEIQWFNYALTNCVGRLVFSKVPLTVEQQFRLDRAEHEGANHWSHRV